MKLLIVTNHSHMLYLFRAALLSALAKEHEVVVCTPKNGKEAELADLGCRLTHIEVDRRGINPRKDLRLYRAYRRLLRAERPDAVITYSIKPNIYAGYACRRLRIPYFLHVQGLGSAFEKPLIATVATLLYRAAAKKARGVFFENEGNRDEFLRRRILSADRAIVLPGAGVDLTAFPSLPYPTEENGIRFLFVGRIMKEKGVDELFSAAERLKAAYGDRVSFLAAGFFEEEYGERVKELSSRGILTYLGFREDILSLYRDCHAVVLPSYHEGMSNVLLEGAACGRALVTSDIPGCREAVGEGGGFLCEAGNAEALYTALMTFLALSPAERAAVGCRARAHIEAHFNRNTVVSLTLAALKEKGGISR